MPNYATTYERLARRALRSADADLEEFFDSAQELGMTGEAIEEALLRDLNTGGPIFGKLRRGLMGAGSQATSEAMRVGVNVAQLAAIPGLEDLDAFTDENINRLLDQADPGALAETERLADDVPYRWVCALVNTCELCLPLHNVVLPLGEWNERGLHPSTIHGNRAAPCYCDLVPQALVADDVQPLRRVVVKSQTKDGFRQTARLVGQQDLDKSLAARDKALASPTGRAILRQLGQVNSEENENAEEENGT